MRDLLIVTLVTSLLGCGSSPDEPNSAPPPASDSAMTEAASGMRASEMASGAPRRGQGAGGMMAEGTPPETPVGMATGGDTMAARPGPEQERRARSALRRGRTLSRRADYAGAIAAFEESLAAIPSRRARCELGWALFRAEEHERAATLLREATRGLPETPRVGMASDVTRTIGACLYNFGRVLEAQGDPAAAAAAYRTSIAYRPNDTVGARLAAVAVAPPAPGSATPALPDPLDADGMPAPQRIVDLPAWLAAHSGVRETSLPGVGRGLLELKSLVLLEAEWERTWLVARTERGWWVIARSESGQCEGWEASVRDTVPAPFLVLERKERAECDRTEGDFAATHLSILEVVDGAPRVLDTATTDTWVSTYYLPLAECQEARSAESQAVCEDAVYVWTEEHCAREHAIEGRTLDLGPVTRRVRSETPVRAFQELFGLTGDSLDAYEDRCGFAFAGRSAATLAL